MFELRFDQSTVFQLGDCDGMTETECENYYRLNAAMVEVTGNS